MPEFSNAFAGQKLQPSDAELQRALGEATAVWEKLIQSLREEHGVDTSEWRCYSVKAGWSLRLKLGKRTIVWLSPGADCFYTSFILGAKALEVLRGRKLTAACLRAIDAGVKYPEGTSIRFVVRKEKDLQVVRVLTLAKVEN